MNLHFENRALNLTKYIRAVAVISKGESYTIEVDHRSFTYNLEYVVCGKATSYYNVSVDFIFNYFAKLGITHNLSYTKDDKVLTGKKGWNWDTNSLDDECIIRDTIQVL